MSEVEFSGDRVSEVSRLLREGLDAPDAAPGEAESSEVSPTEEVPPADQGEMAVSGPETSTEEPVPAEPTEESEPDPEGSFNMRDAAERLGMDEQDVWDGLRVPMGEGESMSVTELREAVRSAGDLEGAWAQLDESNHAREMELLQQRREVDALVQVFREANIPEEVVQRAMGRTQDYQRRQFEVLTTAWPEMLEEGYRSQAREELVSIGQEYGYSRAEIESTEDARAILVLRDLQRLTARRREAADRVKAAGKGRPTPPARNRARANGQGRSAAIERARSSDYAGDKAAGVAAILRGES